MDITVIGLGGMGHALAGRLLDAGHAVSVWNRSPGRSGDLAGRGARVLGSPDDATGPVVLSLADDAAVLAVAAPDGAARPAWRDTTVVSTSTIAPDTVGTLGDLYDDRFVAAFILGAPHAVADGSARWVLGGAPDRRAGLRELWDVFAAVMHDGDSPARAAAVKLLQNHMLLAGLTVVAETVRLGRAAGFDDDALTALLRSSPMVAPGLANRIDALVDPEHRGWFTPSLGAKDLAHALALDTSPADYPVTGAARDAYLRVAGDGWSGADVAAVTELGTTR